MHVIIVMMVNLLVPILKVVENYSFIYESGYIFLHRFFFMLAFVITSNEVSHSLYAVCLHVIPCLPGGE